MVSAQDLELKLQDLFKKKKYSEIISQITLKTKEEDRNAGLFVLLGISRMSIGLKDKNQVSLAVQDFKKGYLKEQKGVNGLNALANFVVASSILSDFEYKLDILACHLLSPTRADLYKQYLNAFHQKTPLLNFICKQTSRLIFVISI